MQRLYKTGIGLTTGFIGSQQFNHIDKSVSINIYNKFLVIQCVMYGEWDVPVTWLYQKVPGLAL
jgi:hypothetical protein